MGGHEPSGLSQRAAASGFRGDALFGSKGPLRQIRSTREIYTYHRGEIEEKGGLSAHYKPPTTYPLMDKDISFYQ